MKKGIIIIVVILTAFGCRKSTSTGGIESEYPDPTAQETQLYEEVIAVHDKVMPRLGDIASLKSRIEEQIGILESNPGHDPERLAKLRNQMKALDEADEAMMAWMRQFIASYEGWKHDSIMHYLNGEKDKIEKVDEMVDNAIRQTKMLLGEE